MMRHPHRTLLRASRALRGGGLLILVALTGFLLVGLAGLALDLAWVRSAEQQLQASADAASLAAARVVRQDTQATQFAFTRQMAVGTALANTAAKASVLVDPNPSNAPGGDVVVGRWDPSTLTFTPDTTTPDAVRVTARRTSGSSGGPLTLFFGQLFDTPTSDVARSAVARADLSQEPLVLLLSTGSRALDMRGSSALTALGGSVHLNSDKDCGLSMSGAPILTAASVDVGGTACLGNGTLNGALNEGAPVIRDPLSQLPPPGFAPPALPTIAGSGTYDPGYYDGIRMSGGRATLNPGVYVIGNQGIRLNGNADLQGDGVMVYLPQPAVLDLNGNARVRLTGPQSGLYQGVTLFQDRTAALKNKLGGNAVLDMEGTCYLFCGSIETTGAGRPKADIGQIIALGMYLHGCAEVEVTGLGLRPPSTASKPILTQ